MGRFMCMWVLRLLPGNRALKVNPLDGKWHHVLVGYDKIKKLMFASVDGMDYQEAPLEKIPEIEAPIRMGSGSTGFLHGALDEVIICDAAVPTLHGGVLKR